MRRLLVVCWLIWLVTGCAHQRVVNEVPDASWSYELEFEASYQLSNKDGRLGEAWELIRDFQESVTMRIGVSFTRLFRDDSHGWWVEIQDMSVTTHLVDRPAVTATHPLQGLGVELRRFGDGEILKIDQTEYWFGGERGGEGYDFIFPLISPHAPDMGRGDGAFRRTRWPFAASRALGWANHQEARWQNEGTAQYEGQKVWRLSYTGTWRVEGGSKTPMPSSEVSGGGPVSGVVLIRVEDYRVVHHSFDWSRTIAWETGATISPGIVQEQRFQGTMRLVP